MVVLVAPRAVWSGGAAVRPVVPILVDASRSMRLRDGGPGQPARLERATRVLDRELLPRLRDRFDVELFAIGTTLTSVSSTGRLSADAAETDLVGALTAVRERYRDRAAGILLLSDGNDTGEGASAPFGGAVGGPPVFAVGIGSLDQLRDRAVTGLTAGEQRLGETSIDLHATMASRGFGRAPFDVRVLANGRPIDTRRVVPAGDDVPIDEMFTVAPDPGGATVYRVEVAPDRDDAAPENDGRSVLVSPAGRKRRVLVVEGAPGFEHSFITRAWSHDPWLDVDVVVRKGTNADGQNMFFVEAGPDGAAALAGGFPARREDLFAYDAVVLANVEGDQLSRAQLSDVAAFVSDRGGGLLVLGSRSLGGRGLAGTPLEPLVPLGLGDRRPVAGASLAGVGAPVRNQLRATDEGLRHPVMRIGGRSDDIGQAWASLPPLAASVPVGAPRPGASVLAVTSTATGAFTPVIAVQPFGRGRVMAFAGEGSWRWRMLLPSADRRYETFWRQAVRWIAVDAPDPVAVTVADGPAAGRRVTATVDARDRLFAPAADATVSVTVTGPDGSGRPVVVGRDERAPGRFTATFTPERAGVYRVHAQAIADGSGRALGGSDGWTNVGGVERELADSRLNEAWLERTARASGGRYTRIDEVSHVVDWLRAAESALPQAPRVARGPSRELWVFAALVVLLCAEWTLRRSWS